MIIGIGTDIVEISRLEKSLKSIKTHCFSASEIAYAEKFRDDTAHFAGRWAAKEAVAKALGCGFGKFCSPVEIEVLSDEFHAPVLALSGNASATAEKLGIVSWSVSVSHEKHYAVAVAIAEISDKK